MWKNVKRREKGVKMRKADSRIPRTRAAIRQAFLDLLGSKDVDDITVTDIAQQASLDRKTIYNYYAGTAAILDDLENELVNAVTAMIHDEDLKRVLSDPFGFLDAVTRAFDQRDPEEVLVKNRRSRVLDKLGTSLKTRVSAFLSEHVVPAKRQFSALYAEFLTSGVVSVYRGWLAGGRTQSLEEIARQVRQLLDGSMASFLL